MATNDQINSGKVITDPNVSVVSDPTATKENTVVNPPKEVQDDDLSDFDFDSFSKEGEELEVVGEDFDGDEPKEPAAKEEPKLESQQEEKKPEEKLEEAPKTEEKKQEAKTEVEAPKVDTPPEVTSEELGAQYQEWFQKSTEYLAENVYKLPDDVKEKLDSNPSEVIPQLAARLHVQVLSAAVAQAANLVATMYPELTKRYSYEQDLENQFYGKYEELKGHSQVVDQISHLYRQLNPNATPEEAMEGIAATAYMQLRITPKARNQPQSTPVPAAVVPTSAGAPGGNGALNLQDTSVPWMKEWFEEVEE